MEVLTVRSKSRPLVLASYSVLALVFAVSTGSMLAACGNANHNPFPVSSSLGAQRPGATPVANGELTGILNQLKASAGWQASGCDAAFESAARQVTGALDAQAAQIAAMTIKQRQAKASNGSIQALDLGGAFLLHNNAPPAPKNQGWVAQEQGWANVLQLFREVKRRPTDQGWVELDNATRAMLRYDEMRLINGDDMNILPANQTGMQSMLQAYETCLADTTCTEPKLNTDAADFRDSDPGYKALWQKLQSSDTAQKRDLIQKTVVNGLRRDAAPFVPRPDPGAVARISATQVEVALDPGNFITSQGGLDTAATAIQNIWSSSSLAVHVRWTQQAAGSQGAFRLVLDPSPNESPITRHADRTIVIGAGRSDRALAVAIGHVLGFGSHAFVDYSPAQCDYQIISNDTDLMSVSSTGSVTSEEWTALDAMYPWSR